MNILKLGITLTCLVCCFNLYGQEVSKLRRIKVDADRSGLSYEDGSPFFWMGDTAWELYNRLTREEIIDYLDDRASKGFNVIQITALSTGGINHGNRYGDTPLTDQDPSKPNEKYFALIDDVIRLAAERNMYIGFVATWGDKVVSVPNYGSDPVIFDRTNAFKYGKWLGNRYKDARNVIWILGGDVVSVLKDADYRPVWTAMAEGIIEATSRQCLITYHPNGYRSSSEWFQDAAWLDFNMIQSSHGEHDAPNWEMVAKDRSKSPAKPTLDAEPNYEDHPVHPWPTWNPDSGYFRAYDVRKQMYRSVFAGAFGVTYGHHAVWQFVNERDEVSNYADRGWRNAIARPGSTQCSYFRKLMESRPLQGRQRDLKMILDGQGTGKYHVEAFRGAANDFAMIYLPVGRSVTIDASFMRAKKVKVWWFNPKDGNCFKSTERDRSASMTFTPPVLGIGNDWVLVLDDPSKHFPDLDKLDYKWTTK